MSVKSGEAQRAPFWIGFLPEVVAKTQRPNPYLHDVFTYEDRLEPVAREVLEYARPGEKLGIWGYMPRFYVETGLPQATREGHNERELLPHPQLAYYRGRYLFDLKRARPPVFLDAVGPSGFWPTHRTQFAHETWKELDDWVRENYVLVDDVSGVRIYVRRDRMPAHIEDSTSKSVTSRSAEPRAAAKPQH